MRRLGSSVLAVVGALALLASAGATWARAELLDRERFAELATTTLSSTEVSELVAREITDRVLAGAPPEVPRPQVEAEVRRAVATPEFRSVFREAAVEIHAVLMTERPGGPLAVDLSGAASIVRSAVARVDPRAPDLIPLEGLSSVDLAEEGDLPSLRALDRAAGGGGGLLLALGAAAVTAAALMDRRPRIPVALAGAVVAAGATAALAGASAVPVVVGARITDPGVEQAVEAVLGDLLSGMRLAAGATAALGSAVVALAWALGRRAKPALLSLLPAVTGRSERSPRESGRDEPPD
ncbi:MAG: hypothetical protein HYU28_03340 [Actinobacteria bacterium]|nr:hypothetical protein [Actinomycetota bacterium]